MTLRFLFYFKVYPLFILFPKIRIYQSNYLLHHITAGYYSTIIFSTLIACKSRIKSLNISRLTSSRKKKLPLHFHYLECFIYLPRFPDIRLISKSGLFSVTDHRCLNHLRVFQSTICLGNRIGKFDSDVTINFNGKATNGKSLLNIIGACIKCGSEVEIQCDGADEEEALKTAIEMIESGLGE